jgi:hypothetical protein
MKIKFNIVMGNTNFHTMIAKSFIDSLYHCPGGSAVGITDARPKGPTHLPKNH